MTDLEAAARAWMAADPDPATRAQLAAVLASGDGASLEDHVGRRLAFGTAGLRAEIGPGPNRMNRLVVRQTAAAVAEVLLREVADAARRGVVVGHVARHRSADFADDCVEVLRDRGLDVARFAGPAPTPLVAHAGRTRGAAATLVVTASHNPAADNGLKVYWDDGAQIVAPVDARIAAAIDRLAPSGDPRPPDGGGQGRLEDLGPAGGPSPSVDAYVRDALDLVGGPVDRVRVAVTSLHGVGGDLLEKVLGAAGVGPLHAVAEQRDPDPDFPTVSFPNPEEPGALDRLVELAAAVGADVALANDPDADRLAVVAPDRDGTWRPLTGDEVGALLAHRLLGRAGDGTDGTERLVATTVVSSRLLARLAAEAGVHYEETLTGFKWLCRPGLANPDWRQVLLYEEALGYAVGDGVRDKDGITAALVLVDLVAGLRRQGRDVRDVLDDQARRHGAHVTANGSVRMEGPGARERLAALVEEVAERPPADLAGRPVVRSDRPAPDVLRWWLDDDTRVVLRPSGTEPKLKYYCEAVVAVTDGVGPARDRGRARLAAVVAALRERVTGGNRS
jgi:phosphomannomutase